MTPVDPGRCRKAAPAAAARLAGDPELSAKLLLGSAEVEAVPDRGELCRRRARTAWVHVGKQDGAGLRAVADPQFGTVLGAAGAEEQPVPYGLPF